MLILEKSSSVMFDLWWSTGHIKADLALGVKKRRYQNCGMKKTELALHKELVKLLDKTLHASRKPNCFWITLGLLSCIPVLFTQAGPAGLS